MSSVVSSRPASCPLSHLDPQPVLRAGSRVACGAVGLAFVTLGFIGVFIPGIPTTGPLLAASYFLAKSHPALQRRLLSNRLFARYHRYLDGSAAMPIKARLWALFWMWTSIAASAGWLTYSQVVSRAVPLAVIGSGLAGTVCILCFRRQHRQPTSATNAAVVTRENR